MVTQLHYLLARQRQADLTERAERARRIRDGGRLDTRYRDPDGEGDAAITLRLAGPADTGAIADLAGLDSADAPAAPVLLAEAGGDIRAAISLRNGTIIADPFHRTLAARELLRARAAQLRGDHRRGWAGRMLRRGWAGRMLRRGWAGRMLRRGKTANRHRTTNPGPAIGAAAANHHE
jgi:hypothetical protein